jgi:hypothetical protein
MSMSMLSRLVQFSDARFAVQPMCFAAEFGRMPPKKNAGVFPARALGEALAAFEFLQPSKFQAWTM